LNILDENIPGVQRRILRSWRMRVRHIGYDLERKGLKDENIRTYLHNIPRATLFTLDEGYYDRQFSHAS